MTGVSTRDTGRPRSNRGRILPSRSFEEYGAPFLTPLAAFVALTVAKVHEVFPPLAALPLVKVAGGALIIVAFLKLDRHDVRLLLRSNTARWLGLMAVIAVASIPLSLWPGFSFRFVTESLWQFLFLFLIVGASAISPLGRNVVVSAFTAARVSSPLGCSSLGG